METPLEKINRSLKVFTAGQFGMNVEVVHIDDVISLMEEYSQEYVNYLIEQLRQRKDKK